MPSNARTTKTREAFAVLFGGMALALAVIAAIIEFERERIGLWAVPLVALIFWREYVFTGMRVELKRLRESQSSGSQ